MRYLFGFLLCLPICAQAPPERPKLFGVAHYSIFVSDLAKARAFYEDFLGYEESFTLPEADGTVQMAFLKINDHQYVELLNEPNKGEGQLNHLGLYTDDVERMRQYLASQGVKVPDQVTERDAPRGFRNLYLPGERPRRPRQDDPHQLRAHGEARGRDDARGA